MKIRINDTEKLQAAIDEVAGKAAAFIPVASDIQDAAERIEAILEGKSLPVAQRKGASASHTPAGPSSQSYRYGATSVTTKLERTSTGWWITEIKRSKIYPGKGEKLEISVTAAQADEIRTRSTADLRVKA